MVDGVTRDNFTRKGGKISPLLGPLSLAQLARPFATGNAARGNLLNLIHHGLSDKSSYPTKLADLWLSNGSEKGP